MLNTLIDGLSILMDALFLLSRSWGFWVSLGSVAGLLTVYWWKKTRFILCVAGAGVLFFLATVGVTCSKVADRNALLWLREPDRLALPGMYEVVVSPKGECFMCPEQLTGFFQISASRVRLNEDGTCEVTSFPRRKIWSWWIAHPENRNDVSLLENDLVAVFHGFWTLEKFGAYYGISITCGPDNGYRLYFAGPEARQLIMPLSFDDSLEAVIFSKKH